MVQKELQEGEGLREERRKASKGRKENSFSLFCIMLGGRKHGDFSLKSLLNKESFPNSLSENPQVWEVYGRTVSSKQTGKSERVARSSCGVSERCWFPCSPFSVSLPTPSPFSTICFSHLQFLITLCILNLKVIFVSPA